MANQLTQRAASSVAWRSGAAMRLRSRRSLSPDSVTASCLAVMIGACIFLQRMAVPLSETAQVPAAFVVGYGVFLILLFRSRLVIDTSVTALFFVAMSVMTVSVVVSDATSSLSSFTYLLSIYVLYLFRLKYARGAFQYALNIFLKLMLFCALLGIAQFLLQFVVGWETVFPLDTYLPSNFLLVNYNTIIPLEYESEVMKANGVFFLEPSFFSQFLGLAVLIETFGKRRPIRLAIYGVAIMMSYSGTGLMLVALFLPWIILKRGNAGVLIAGAAIALVVALAGGALDLSALTNRVGEFGSTESSGFARFISPYLLMRDFVIQSPSALLFGLGSGAIDKVMADAFLPYLAHDPTWIKVALEYGVPALALFMSFVAMAIFHGTRNKVLSWAVFCFYLFLGGYLLNGALHCLFVALTAWHNRPVYARRTAFARHRRRLQPIHRRAVRRPASLSTDIRRASA